jgi:hypothetical protein
MSKAKYSQNNSAKAPAKNAGFGAKNNKNGKNGKSDAAASTKDRKPYLIAGAAVLVVVGLIATLMVLNVF